MNFTHNSTGAPLFNRRRWTSFTRRRQAERIRSTSLCHGVRAARAMRRDRVVAREDRVFRQLRGEIPEHALRIEGFADYRDGCLGESWNSSWRWCRRWVSYAGRCSGSCMARASMNPPPNVVKTWSARECRSTAIVADVSGCFKLFQRPGSPVADRRGDEVVFAVAGEVVLVDEGDEET
jgi:hypothetical protein